MTPIPTGTTNGPLYGDVIGGVLQYETEASRTATATAGGAVSTFATPAAAQLPVRDWSGSVVEAMRAATAAAASPSGVLTVSPIASEAISRTGLTAAATRGGPG
ncbi:hypothetical protein [Microvirga lotononidis]|uniref:hypothetical protein n=1 Tax=Microvirga lotononidis TaxID=864069 RepID=UPI0012B5F086|nr:hypothetical protein [Microvirga lotononidis]WQO30714.1 hypothetical protein U0023_25135 [Microvirga lotononidis]